MAAFCEGLGSPLNLPDGVTEEFMFRMGGLVREAVSGTVDLLNARAVTKREVKASATVIMERNNNPLKFSPDAKTAMLYLVSGRLNPAFMPPIARRRAWSAWNACRCAKAPRWWTATGTCWAASPASRDARVV